METEIQLIRDRSALEGTAYFEFLPGRYADKHWNKSSVFLDEEVMCLIERPFMDALPDYDHYSFCDVSHARWQSVLSGLSDLRDKLAAAQSIGDVASRFCCIWPGTEKAFAVEFDENKKNLIDLVVTFTDWINETLQEHESIAVLGM